MSNSKSDIAFGIKLKGEYRLQVFSEGHSPEKKGKKSKARIDTGFFENILTDSFFDAWVGGSTAVPHALTAFCGVGSGTSTPAANNTTITQVGVRATRFSKVTANASLTNTATCQYRFNINDVIGTIGEVALFTSSSGGNTNTRALIKDVGGTPTTITLITGDTLYVTWRCSCTISASDFSGTVSISGVNYNWTARPCNFTADIGAATINNVFIPTANGGNMGGSNAFGLGNIGVFATQTLGANTSSPSGTSFFGGSATVGSYTAGSFTRTVTYTLLPAQGNTGSGIGSFMVCSASNTGSAGFQISLAAVSGGGTLPKDGTKTYTQPITYVFSR